MSRLTFLVPGPPAPHWVVGVSYSGLRGYIIARKIIGRDTEVAFVSSDFSFKDSQDSPELATLFIAEQIEDNTPFTGCSILVAIEDKNKKKSESLKNIIVPILEAALFDRSYVDIAVELVEPRVHRDFLEKLYPEIEDTQRSRQYLSLSNGEISSEDFPIKWRKLGSDAYVVANLALRRALT